MTADSQYPDTDFFRGAEKKTARTWADHYQLMWEGFRPSGPAPALDPSVVAAHKSDIDLINATVAALTKEFRGSDAPLHRQRNNFRRLGPVTTDLTSASNTAGHDATLTKAYATALGTLPVNKTRRMTDAEYAAQPYIQYPITNVNPRIWNISGVGYVLPTGSPTNTVDASETYWPNITMQRFETMTDAPSIEFTFYAYLGVAVTSIQAYVDGAPVTLAPQAYPGAVSYYKLTFPAGKKPRLVEIVTEGLLTFISIAPNYKCWKPPTRRGPKLMVLGASYCQPYILDGTSGSQTFNRYGHWSQMDAYADIDQIVIDGIGGTGFVTPASSGVGYPVNTYVDRIPGVITARPDILVFGDAFSNDLHSGASTAATIAAAKVCIDQVKAALPNTKIVFQTGLRTPTYGDFSTGYDTIKTALKAAYPNQLYWIDLRTAMDMTGGYIPGHTNGLGNTDFYIGSDGVHPTKEGADYLRGWLYPAIQKVLWDDGTLIGKELI